MIKALTLSLLFLLWPAVLRSSPFTHGIVASGHPLATEAGLKVLRDGGNAVDAAISVALTLGVVDGQNSGLGGGCFMLIRLADGKLVALDGRETAPMAATRDMFLKDGVAQMDLCQTGPLASGVPGSLAVYDYASKHFGKKKWKELFLPAGDLAEQGVILNNSSAARLKEVAADMSRFTASRDVFFKTASTTYEAGDTLKQNDLARSYRAIATQGSKWFYEGDFARATARWMKENGGLITELDFAAYKIEIRQPLLTTYRGFTIVGFPPPSSGGVHVAEALNILETFDLKTMEEAARLHVLAETMKLVFADRAHWLGDPAFARVPRGLSEKDYAKTLAKSIHLDHAVEVPSHGTPSGWNQNYFKKHTTHFSVADDQGNWVACTATVNTSFGSKVVIPGTGIVLNNQMDDFSISPGTTNYFGLIGAEANAVAAGKRPLSSMTPTIILRNGKPLFALGAAGGPKIISQVIQEIVALIDLQLPVEQAIAQPRIHHQWFPDELCFEPALPAPLRGFLQERGHKLKASPAMGISQIVGQNPATMEFLGAADPRGYGSARGW